jgi:hypothetical protein
MKIAIKTKKMKMYNCRAVRKRGTINRTRYRKYQKLWGENAGKSHIKKYKRIRDPGRSNL